MHLKKLKQKIEERKKIYNIRKRTPETITIKEHNLSDNLENNRININENKSNETVGNQNVEDDLAPVNVPAKTNKINKQQNEFKVLGNTDFEKKTKVSTFNVS